jgi:tRNA(Glu) U13 pseudouridine synthase TruD
MVVQYSLLPYLLLIAKGLSTLFVVGKKKKTTLYVQRIFQKRLGIAEKKVEYFVYINLGVSIL